MRTVFIKVITYIAGNKQCRQHFLFNFQAVLRSVFSASEIHLCEPGFSFRNLAYNVGS